MVEGPVDPDAAGPATTSLLSPGTPPSAVVRPGPLTDAAARDLQLDALFAPLLRDAPWLAPWYAAPCPDPATVRYRQAIARDLARPEIADPFGRFVQRIAGVRRGLDAATRIPDPVVADAWFLSTAQRYIDATTALADELTEVTLDAEGVRAAREDLAAVVTGGRFVDLRAGVARVRTAIAEVAYTVRLQGSRITVDRDTGGADLTEEVAEALARFRTGPRRPPDPLAVEPGLDPVAARILALVAGQHPDTFAALHELAATHRELLDPLVARLAREAPFYLAYLDRTARLRRAGLPFCDPEVVDPGVSCRVEGAYDVAVALAHVADGQEVVANDWHLDPPEGVLVVTGANQGGKTTFARSFGQLHHLASLGLPVPAVSARVGLHDRLLTHFERQERIGSLRGKLEDELVRIHEVLEQATPHSIVVMNETFSSTTLDDARDLGTAVLQRLARLGTRGVFVTFVDELATLNATTVSMVATVRVDDPTVRTFRVRRQPPDGRAHAIALAERYGLTQAALRQRLEP